MPKPAVNKDKWILFKMMQSIYVNSIIASIIAYKLVNLRLGILLRSRARLLKSWLRERDFEHDAQRVCWNSKSIWWVSWPRRNAASYQPRNLNSSRVLDNFDRRNVKRRTKCFSEEVLHVCEEERSHTVSLQKFINEILLRAAIDRFLRACCRSANHFPLSLTLLLLRQIKH